MNYDTKTIVAIAALLVDEFGYRKDYGTNSLDNTKAYTRIMYEGLFGNLRDIREKEVYEEKLAPLVAKSQTYSEKAEKILNWIRNYDTSNVTNKSEFFKAKMKYAVRNDEISSRDLGYVACLPNSYNKEVETNKPKVSPVTGRVIPPKVVEPPKPIEPKIEEPPKVVEPPKPIKPKVVETPKVTSSETIEIDGMTFGNKPGFLPTPSWMERKYREFNKKYFDGKLPLDIEFKTSKKATRWAGQASGVWRYGPNGKEIKAKAIKLAIAGLHTEKHTCDILLHEMIHIWQYAVRKDEGGHGYDFIQEMNRINKYGWKVETTESWENQQQDEENPEIKKDFERLKMMVIVKGKSGDFRFCLMSKSSLGKAMRMAQLGIEAGFYKAVSFYSFKDATGYYKGYQTTNVSSGFAGYTRKADWVRDITTSGKLKLEHHMGKEELLEETTFDEIYRLSENSIGKSENDEPLAKVGEMYVTGYKKEGDTYEVEFYTE